MAAAVQQAGGAIGGLGTLLRLTIFTWLSPQMAMTSCSFKLNTQTGGPGGDTLGSLLLSWQTAFSAQWKAACATACTLVGEKLSVLYPGPAPLSGIVSDGSACSGGSSPLPQQVAGLVQIHTQNQGRWAKGRMFMPFPWAAAVDTDYTPTAAYVSTLSTLAAAFVNNINLVGATGTTYGIIPVIFHRKAAKPPGPGANTFTAVTGTFTEKEWATQRKRGNFGRHNVDSIS